MPARILAGAVDWRPGVTPASAPLLRNDPHAGAWRAIADQRGRNAPRRPAMVPDRDGPHTAPAKTGRCGCGHSRRARNRAW